MSHDDKAEFWAHSFADQISSRKKFHYLDKEIPESILKKKWTVKSSSSLSGVLHIGRLSDIIRGEAVFRALKDKGFNAEFIYVTEDMDPIRSIPKGVPEKFKEYMGFAVSDAPDPFGCHSNYGDHFKEEFLGVMNDFLVEQPKVYSMRAEYKKGSFTDSIIELIGKQNELKEIINKFKDNKLADDWCLWKPVCDKCGNLQTTQITGFDGFNVNYKCVDYEFEKGIAKGCGFEGSSDLRKANGKIAWKAEWASQWKFWNVCSEGAGKDYNAPNSAFFVNAEIVEKLLDFPMPTPIFYEHIFIGGEKMSASKGNVVYPAQWLEVSRPEALKYLYMKKINKARSFLWSEVPRLESELDKCIKIAKNIEPASDEKDKKQQDSLFLFSHCGSRKLNVAEFEFDLAVSLLQLYASDDAFLEALSKLNFSITDKLSALERIKLARKFIELHVPAEQKISFLESISPDLKSKISSQGIEIFHSFIGKINSLSQPDDIQNEIFSLIKANNFPPAQIFKDFYLTLIGKECGPRLGLLILALGKDKVVERLSEF